MAKIAKIQEAMRLIKEAERLIGEALPTEWDQRPKLSLVHRSLQGLLDDVANYDARMARANRANRKKLKAQPA